MKKRVIIAILLFMILLISTNIQASSVSSILTTPSIVKPGDIITCNISIDSKINIVSFNSNISVSGGTITEFKVTSGTGGLNGNKIGIMFDTLKSGNINIGELKIKVPTEASLNDEIKISLSGNVGNENFVNTAFDNCQKIIKVQVDNNQNNNENTNIDDNQNNSSNDNNNNNNPIVPSNTSNKENNKYESNLNKNEENNKNNETKNIIKKLKIEGIDFKFDENTFKYELEVDNNIDRLTLSYEFAEPNASIKVKGGNYLNVGKNEKKIIVTSENGETKTYTFIINRAEKEIITEVKDENDKNQNENKDSVNISNSKKDNSNVLLIIIVLVTVISIIGIIIFKKIKNKK